MLQLMNLLKSSGFILHFATASQKGAYSFNLDEIDIQEHVIKLNDNSADLILKSINPDVVIFDRFITEEQFGWKVDELCPNALKVLDTEDLHFLREEREDKLKNKKNENHVLSDKAKRELACMWRCDLNLIISEFELNLLISHYNFPEKLLYYLPLLVEDEGIKSSRGFSQRSHFVSIGNFKHKPNYDMVTFTYKHIWPLIKKQLPNAEWHIYGAYLPESIAQLHSPKKGVMVKGRAEDAFETIGQYKVMLAYLRFGAGLKQKCIDAMASGAPISTTQIGAEGLSSQINWPGIIEEDIEAFVRQSTRLYSDKNFWNLKHEKGFIIIKEKFLKDLFESDFILRINDGSERLKDLRANNIIGQMLKHHMLKSTKYMSLWIEEKNKKRTD